MKKCFKKRTVEQDNILLNNFFMKGIDDEDLEVSLMLTIQYIITTNKC